MIQLIPLCIMAIADAVCPAEIPARSFVQIDLHPVVCLANVSDSPGAFRPPKDGERFIYVSSNIRACKATVAAR